MKRTNKVILKCFDITHSQTIPNMWPWRELHPRPFPPARRSAPLRGIEPPTYPLGRDCSVH